jgi:hypothetical protein
LQALCGLLFFSIRSIPPAKGIPSPYIPLCLDESWKQRCHNRMTPCLVRRSISPKSGDPILYTVLSIGLPRIIRSESAYQHLTGCFCQNLACCYVVTILGT